MNLDLQFYWGLILRRLPAMTALFLACSVTATVVSLKLPPTYSSSAQLLVEEAQIPDTMVAAVVQADAIQQLQVIEQRLLTRANMLDIARKYNVLEDMRSMTPDAIVDAMREQTSIRRTGGRSQATLMNVAFEATSGQIAANVVNEYVTLILQESSDFRITRAENTLSFFEQEVQRLNDDLGQQSVKIIEFKNANQQALPGDLTYRQGRQTLLQERQSRLERELAALKSQRNNIIAVFEASGGTSVQNGKPLSREAEMLAELELQLEQSLGIYSENNPRITLLRTRIETLKKTMEGSPSSLPATGDAGTPQLSALDLSLAEMDQRITNMEQELAETSVELEDIEDSIRATAGNAVTLGALERDFENIQARYNEAVSNLNQARVNERIEVSAQGQRITVIENASIPQEPSGPSRKKYIAAGVAVGAALALGFFALLEILNRNIRRPYEMQSKYGIVPLAVIPYMESRQERMTRRAILVGAFLAVLIGVPTALYLVDTMYMPLDLLTAKVFDRLGLT